MTPARELPLERLPLRVDPVLGEAWPSYLERVASAYQCHPALLVAPIHDQWGRRLRRDRRPATVQGVGMARITTVAVAHRLNLRVHEVQEMQLSAHDEVTVTLPRVVADTFDPVQGGAPIHRLADTGWIGRSAGRRWCLRCEQMDPGVRLLHWAYPWVVMCLRHRELLHPYDPDTTQEVMPQAWERLHQVQYGLEQIVLEEGCFARLSPREGFAEMLAMTVQLMACRHGIRCGATNLWQPWVMADVLPLAWEAVQTPIDRWSADLLAAIDTPRRRAYLTNALQWHGANSPFGLRGDLAGP